MPDDRLTIFYETLLERYGPQHWWPGDGPFEVMVGAVLTQNTNWSNVEKAIAGLKRADKLSPDALHSTSTARIAELIRPAGYFRIKARRLSNLVDWLMETCNGRLGKLKRWFLAGWF